MAQQAEQVICPKCGESKDKPQPMSTTQSSCGCVFYHDYFNQRTGWYTSMADFNAGAQRLPADVKPIKPADPAQQVEEHSDGPEQEAAR